MRKRFEAKLLLGLALLSACGNDKQETAVANEPATVENTGPATINYAVVKTLPHDTTAFTEGLLVHNGQVFESTGSPEDMPQTRSLIGVVDLQTGKLEPKIEIDRNRYFGEGMVILNGKIYQLTYTTKKGFVYDAATYKKLGEFTFPSNEGWGMTTEGQHLIMSDGTSVITYLNPETFQVVKELNVRDTSGPVANLNELEYINGFLYANIYTTNTIVKIDPATGQVVGRMDLSQLAQDAVRKYPKALELNGIAYDSAAGHVLVTGKMWPTMYALKFGF